MFNTKYLEIMKSRVKLYKDKMYCVIKAKIRSKAILLLNRLFKIRFTKKRVPINCRTLIVDHSKIIIDFSINGGDVKLIKEPARLIKSKVPRRSAYNFLVTGRS